MRKRFKYLALVLIIGLLVTVFTNCDNGFQASSGDTSSLWPGGLEYSADGFKPDLRKTMLAGGWIHSCLLDQGEVQCWGGNHAGQLGIGNVESGTVPAPVSNLPGYVVQVVAGGYTTCALLRAGSVLCWGDDSAGTVGDGPQKVGEEVKHVLLPSEVVGLPNTIVRISSGVAYTCALSRAGEVFCWGDNIFGQIGDQTNSRRYSAVNVSAHVGQGVIQISASYSATCALYKAGGVKCWGSNYNGHLGNGSEELSWYPVPVSGLQSGVKEIYGGSHHICARLQDSSVWCWGTNTYGQLGDGTEEPRHKPIEIFSANENVVGFSAGGDHSCALISGEPFCWGYNSKGQLGNGSNEKVATPLKVGGLAGEIVQLLAGYRHSCAYFADYTVKCWGDNASDQLGDGSGKDSFLPVLVRFNEK